MWPELTVRPWRGVQDLRQAEVEHYYSDDLYDRVEAGRESRRIHELRGVFMAQVAEIEHLLQTLINLVAEHRAEWLPVPKSKLKKIPAKKALDLVRDIAAAAGQATEMSIACSQVTWLLARRNQLVHAVVTVGYNSLGPYAPREPVIVLLDEIQQNGAQVPWELAPLLKDAGTPGDWGWEGDSGEISEQHLEEDLRRAYIVLEGAVDIFQALAGPLELLPRRHASSACDDDPPF